MCGIIIKTNTTLTKIRTINVAPAAIDGRSSGLADVEDNDVVEDDEDERDPQRQLKLHSSPPGN